MILDSMGHWMVFKEGRGSAGRGGEGSQGGGDKGGGALEAFFPCEASGSSQVASQMQRAGQHSAG